MADIQFTNPDDMRYMSRALQLAQKGLYTTDPNPRVGCVIVKNNEIVGEGWHERAGGPHAEINALQHAGERASGATVYVTLEPCSHFGKTPPCADALINAKVARVVAAMSDPNPLVAGNGFEKLAQAGITTQSGLLQAQAEDLNPGFVKRMRDQRPFIRSKLAMSLDGRTAMASGESQWITGQAARRDAHRLRARSSAILTGINTVLADDPSLDARLDNVDIEQPVRVVLDSSLRIPLDAKILSLPGRTIIITSSGDEAKAEKLQQLGVEVVHLHTGPRRIDLQELMKILTEKKQFNEIMVEAGPVLNGALLQTQLLDELVVYMAPSIMGDEARGLFALPLINTMQDRILLDIKEIRAVGHDWRISAKVKYQG